MKPVHTTAIILITSVILGAGVILYAVDEPTTQELREQSPKIEFLEFEQNFIFVNAMDRSESFDVTTDDGFHWSKIYNTNIISAFDDNGIHRFDIEVQQRNPHSPSDRIELYGQCRNQPSVCFQEQNAVIYTIHEKTNYKVDTEFDDPLKVNDRLTGMGYNDDGVSLFMNVDDVMPKYEYDLHIMPEQTLVIYYVPMIDKGTDVDVLYYKELELPEVKKSTSQDDEIVEAYAFGKFLSENPTWTFINNTNARTDVCDTTIKSAFGFACENEKQVQLTYLDKVTSAGNHLTDVKTGMSFTIDDPNLLWKAMGQCDKKGGDSTLYVLQSTHEWKSHECVGATITEPKIDAVLEICTYCTDPEKTIDEKLDHIIELLEQQEQREKEYQEYMKLESLSEMNHEPYPWALEQHHEDGRICFYDNDGDELECFRK
jgi:hypothetical protein